MVSQQPGGIYICPPKDSERGSQGATAICDDSFLETISQMSKRNQVMISYWISKKWTSNILPNFVSCFLPLQTSYTQLIEIRYENNPGQMMGDGPVGWQRNTFVGLQQQASGESPNRHDRVTFWVRTGATNTRRSSNKSRGTSNRGPPH